MEKYTLQTFIDILVKQSGLSKKTAEALSKAFFDTITEGLTTDGFVKIKGFGTFRIVEVADRESVNVQNGERILIAGYKKVAFVPADTATPASSGEEPIPSVQLELPDEQLSDTPQDAFSGIDMLISTPETLEDIRQQCALAKARAEETLRQANEAYAEQVRLQRLLQRLEAQAPVPLTPNSSPLPSDSQVTETPAETEESLIPEPQVTEAPAETEAPLPEAPSPLPEEPEEDDENETRPMSWVHWLLIPLAGILLALLAILVYKKCYHPLDAEKPAIEQRKERPTPLTPSKEQPADLPQKKDTVAAPKPSPKQDKRPRTYVVQPGESLTRISRKIYGTADSVRAIIRLNRFPNPDNVPAGVEVKLP